MLASNRTLPTERQRYAETRRQHTEYRFHRAQVRARYKRQFSIPIPRQRQTSTSDDPESIEKQIHVSMASRA